MPELSSTQADTKVISVHLNAGEPRQYDIVVHSGGLTGVGAECQQVLPPQAKILLLTDSHLETLCLYEVLSSLNAAGFQVVPLIIPAGENSKSFEQARLIQETLSAHHFTRKDAILGLGGGVIGDLAGFCASTYHRGMGMIHVPTTLVSQVDSAIGGKTAVNLGQIKNLVGTFHQPLRVIVDTDALLTLPSRELAAGMAEVIKYGLIETACDGGTGFFDWLTHHAGQNSLRTHFPEMIRRCAAIKAAVVMQDETETKGLRFYLNLGHTFGHAYESLSHYAILHGEAVAIGMWQAMRLSIQLGLFPVEMESRLLSLYEATGLAEAMQQAPIYPAVDLLAVMKHDKKNRDANVRLILPVGQVGQVQTRDDIADEVILSVLG